MVKEKLRDIVKELPECDLYLKALDENNVKGVVILLLNNHPESLIPIIDEIDNIIDVNKYRKTIDRIINNSHISSEVRFHYRFLLLLEDVGVINVILIMFAVVVVIMLSIYKFWVYTGSTLEDLLIFICFI